MKIAFTGAAVMAATFSMLPMAFADRDDDREDEKKDRPGGVSLGFEVGPTFVLDNQEVGDSAGIGFAGRIGYELRLGPLFITPEAKMGFESPGLPDVFRIMGGVRTGLEIGLSPVAFAHLGGLAGDLQGFTWDVGGGVDLDLGAVAIGVAVSYNRAEDGELTFANLQDDSAGWEWIQVAAGLTLVF